MIKNYLLITWRSMMKNKLFLTINIFGMGISIACCIVAFFNYNFNREFDTHHENASTIYRVNSVRAFQGETTLFGHVPTGLGNAVAQNVKDIDELVRYSPGNADFRVDDNLHGAQVIYVDSGFFKLFTYAFIDGNGGLEDRGKIFISDELARIWFGTEYAAGKMVTQVLDSGKLRAYEVGGVFRKQPINSSFYADAYTSFYNQFNGSTEAENDWRGRITLFAQIKDPSRLETVTAQLQPYTENNNKVREDFLISEFQLQSMVGMGVSDNYNDVPGTWTRAGSPLAAVAGVGMMGILILLLSCFNLTNTSIAISSRRLKEIGVRKVMGSMRGHLIAQFIGETMVVCLIALIVGVVLAEFWLIPSFNQLWPDMKLETDYLNQPLFLLFLVGTLLFTAVLAGAYPAFYISRFQPVNILKGKLKFGGTNAFTRVLLTLQFAISLTGIVGSAAFIDNARYQRELDLGFKTTGVIVTRLANHAEVELWKNAMAQNKDVETVAGSEHHLYMYYINDPVRYEDKEIEIDILHVDDEYLKAMGMSLTEGRAFVKNSETDRVESVIVTEGLAGKFGWDNPIGKRVVWRDTVQLYVIGVIKDVYNRGLWEEMSPLMLRYANEKDVRFAAVSTAIDKVKNVNAFMEQTWKELFPNRIYNGYMMESEMIEADTINSNIVKMFVFLGIVAVLLSATGLFSLVSLNMIKRLKEIGVRKVLGASIGNIARVVNVEFGIILLLACVLGGAAGASLANLLMASIWDYYQPATIASIVWSALLLLILCVMSVAHKIISTARLNPSQVLRDE